MNAIDVDSIELNNEQSLPSDRFILTQVIGTQTGIEQHFTLVFPAIWVAEILRVDRSQILELPFYDRTLIGVIDRGGQITPLIAAAHCLKLQPSFGEKLMVVRLNEANAKLGNVGLIIDRLVGTTTRAQLPSDLFTTHRSAEMVIMRLELVPTNIWQPQY
jgi:chemotaxis signal transduction protein